MQLQFSVLTFCKTKTGERFASPEVPITVKGNQGVRVILGDDGNNCSAPGILMERRSRGWLIFLHPNGTEDASGYLFIRDGGKSFVIPGNKLGGEDSIEYASLEDYDSIESMIDLAEET